MTRERTLALAGVLVLAAAGATAIATRTHASEKDALARLSNHGRAVSVARSPFVQQTNVRQASLLEVRAGRAYYQVEGEDGTCFAAGRATEVGSLGAVECPRGPFPTAERPVLDLSVYEATTRGRREVALYRAEGIAADGVAAVAFLRPNGRVALEVPVRGNVFSTASVPAGPIAGIAALGADGSELWRSP